MIILWCCFSSYTAGIEIEANVKNYCENSWSWNRYLVTHWSSPEGWRRSACSSLSYSAHSVGLQRSLCTDTSRRCPHTGSCLPSPQHCRYILVAAQMTHKISEDSGHYFSSDWWATYVCRHRDGPFCCGGLVDSPGHTCHTLGLWCGADNPHTHLHSFGRWPGTAPGQNDSAGHGCYIHTLWGQGPGA